MLQVKFFKPNDEEGFNRFLKDHAPRNGDKTPGININPNGMYVFYEDGEPYSLYEQLEFLDRQIWSNKHTILVSIPMLRRKEVETEEFEELLRRVEEAQNTDLKNGVHVEHRLKVERERQLKELKEKIDSNHAWILTAKAGMKEAEIQIKHYNQVKDELKRGILEI